MGEGKNFKGKVLELPKAGRYTQMNKGKLVELDLEILWISQVEVDSVYKGSVIKQISLVDQVLVECNFQGLKDRPIILAKILSPNL